MAAPESCVVDVALPGNVLPEAAPEEAGAVVVENDLPAAIEVQLGQEVRVLYPGRNGRFQTGQSDKVSVSLRDEPHISGSCQVSEGAATLVASESFGSFGPQARELGQKEQQEVEREKSLLEDRKKRVERVRREISSFTMRCFYGNLSCTALLFCALVAYIFVDPNSVGNPGLLFITLVLLLMGLSTSSFCVMMHGATIPRPMAKKLTFHGGQACCFLGGLAATIAT